MLNIVVDIAVVNQYITAKVFNNLSTKGRKMSLEENMAEARRLILAATTGRSLEKLIAQALAEAFNEGFAEGQARGELVGEEN